MTRVSGREVLYTLRDREREGFCEAGVAAYDIGQRLGRRDGRSVTRTLARLERAKLVARADRQAYWRTTERGRVVEVLCSANDARRGGSFAPMVEYLDDQTERFALSHS